MRICESSPVQVSTGVFNLTINVAGDSHLVFASSAFLDIVDRTSAQVEDLAGDLSQLAYPDDRIAFRQALHRAAQSCRETFWEGRFQTETAVKSVRVDLIPPGKGDPGQAWTGVLQDLTDVVDLQKRFEAVLDASQGFTWRRDIRSDTFQFDTRWSRFAKHNDGVSSMSIDEWLTKVHPEDVSDMRAAVQELLDGNAEHHRLLYRRRLEDGTWVWLRVHAGISERDLDGTPTALSGVSFDITEEMQNLWRFKSANEELRSQLTDAQTLLERSALKLTENIPVGTYTMILSPDNEFAQFGFMSRKFLEITGLKEEDARADPMQAFACVHPDDRDDWIQKNAHAFVHKLHFHEEARLLIKGQIRWIVAESVPRQAEGGKWIWEGVMQDITSQKIRDNALRHANEKLLETERAQAKLKAREDILQDIHDGFGNQLAVAKLRLRRGAVNAEQAAKIIDDCIDDLRLLFESIDAEGESFLQVLEGLAGRVNARVRTIPIKIDWHIDAACRIVLPPTIMLRIARIVQEAVTNAIRHADAQCISVTVTADNDGRQIEVKDDGQGFDVNAPKKGLGIRNMQLRAERSGFHLNIASDRSGTCVTLIFG